VEVRELAPGLWRWTALHPDWTPAASKGGEGWEQEVGCVYLETAAAVILIDPLVPGEPAARETFLEQLDADVERHGKPVSILLTVSWHERSAHELAERYGADVWANETGTDADTPVTSPFAPGTALPGGVIGIDVQVAEETIYWLPEQRALVPGDALLGDGDGGLRVCPESWLGEATQAELRVQLHGLLDLPVELVLVSHGEPVLADGRAALAAALQA
jgi:glyoxylase-like metal-dependent hydrolase (beta-lactamase superfamily II)